MFFINALLGGRISSHRQLTSGDPPAWGLGELLTTPHHKNWPCYEMDICAWGLD